MLIYSFCFFQIVYHIQMTAFVMGFPSLERWICAPHLLCTLENCAAPACRHMFPLHKQRALQFMACQLCEVMLSRFLVHEWQNTPMMGCQSIAGRFVKHVVIKC